MVRFDPRQIERFWRAQNPRRRALRERLDARRLPYGVALENLSKDWNIGNLIRSANAFLCGEIILVGNDAFDQTGARHIHRFERIRHHPDHASFLDHVRATDYQLIAVEIDPHAELLHRFTFPPRPLFLFGAELQGLSPELAAHADARLMIPQYGLAPCLNVNIACTLVLYEYVTRRHPDLAPTPVTGSKYLLDPGSGQQSRKEGR